MLINASQDSLTLLHFFEDLKIFVYTDLAVHIYQFKIKAESFYSIKIQEYTFINCHRDGIIIPHIASGNSHILRLKRKEEK